MTKLIPNFSTLSTLVDRLSIENVKLAHFQNELEHDGPDEVQKKQLTQKVITQKEIIAALKEELTGFLEDVFVSGKYEIMTEERTFT